MTFVSIIIPCRNEEEFISQCLDSIIKQDYPKDKLEVLVMDGASEDNTKKIVGQYSQKHSFIKLFNNPRKFTPFAMNIGIINSKGDIIMKMDAHAIYRKDYVSKCQKYLNDYKADGVGGIIISRPKKNTIVNKAIALCLSSKFGAGNSYFKTGVKEPRWVDAVGFGCFRKEIFDKVGLYNENLIRSQDMELNMRIKKAGGKILLAPDIVSYYYPKSTLKDFLKHNFNDGVWAIYPLKFVKAAFRIRHYLPLIFVLITTLTGILGLFYFPSAIAFFSINIIYYFIAIYFSFKIALREKDIRLLFVLPVVFSSRHNGYGFGSLWGLIKLL